MRIMLVWPTEDRSIGTLLQLLEEAGHEVIYWAGTKQVSDLTPKGTIFHDHYDALENKPAGTFTHELIRPLSSAELDGQLALESLILSMMDKHYDRSPVDERKHVFYNMLAYWTHVFEELKPQAVVYGNMPHSIYTNIAYELALQRGIPTICFEDPWAWVPGHTLLYRNFWKGSDELRAAIARLNVSGVELASLGKDVRAYWHMHVERMERKTTAAMVSQKRTAVGWGMLRHRSGIAATSLRNGSLFRLTYKYLRRHIGENLPKEYQRFVRSPDWDIPFVYFPLHFQPERATSPLGGVYHDQILAAETLAAALPEGWELYVKEHPSQWWLRDRERYNSARYRGYYRRLASIPRVRIVPVSTNTFDLIERSQSVATVTGTAGWEALMRGKCPVVLGFPWYRDCPGVLKVSSVDECADAFKALQNGASIEKQELLVYFKALEEACIHAYVDLIFTNKPFSDEENMRRLGKAICDELQKSATL